MGKVIKLTTYKIQDYKDNKNVYIFTDNINEFHENYSPNLYTDNPLWIFTGTTITLLNGISVKVEEHAEEIMNMINNISE